MSKKIKIALIVVTLLLVASVSFVSGCFISFSGSRPNLSLINQAWNVIYQNYVDPTKLDPNTQNQAAVKGILDSVKDPYSVYLNPQDYQLYQNQVNGKFEGIGATVELNAQSQPSVVSTLPGSPAGAAGIKAGDIILAVDGKSTSGMSLTAIVLEVQGPAGTQVTLTVTHTGETTPVDITITRAQINQSSVSWVMKGSIAYIQIFEFNETTNDELNNALTSINLTTTTGIILDLRDNPGGLVTTVVDVASHFIKDGIIITLVDNKGNKTSDSVNPNRVFTDLPMVVLVNGNSASGAEVLTGALHDHNRATVAGVKTFGKGSYDSAFTLSDGSAIYMTIGRWLTPNGNAIEGQGITPDDVLTQTGDAEIQWAIDFLNGTPFAQ